MIQCHLHWLSQMLSSCNRTDMSGPFHGGLAISAHFLLYRTGRVDRSPRFWLNVSYVSQITILGCVGSWDRKMLRSSTPSENNNSHLNSDLAVPSRSKVNQRVDGNTARFSLPIKRAKIHMVMFSTGMFFLGKKQDTYGSGAVFFPSINMKRQRSLGWNLRYACRLQAILVWYLEYNRIQVIILDLIFKQSWSLISLFLNLYLGIFCRFHFLHQSNGKGKERGRDEGRPI